MRRRLGITVGEICEDLGIERWDYSRKTACRNSRWTIEEIGQLADCLERRSGRRVPYGWPFLPESVAAFLERSLAAEGIPAVRGAG